MISTMEIKTTVKRRGNSLGIILPKSVVIAENIRENDNVTIEIKEKALVGDLFGKFPIWKRSAQKIKDEARKGWE